MKQSLQKIQRIFSLEADNGYNNRAVIGGLDRMLEPWQAEARAEGVSEEIIQAVVARIRDYPRLTPASRAEVLEGLRKRIQRGDAPQRQPEEQPAKDLPQRAPPKRDIPARESRPARREPRPSSETAPAKTANAEPLAKLPSFKSSPKKATGEDFGQDEADEFTSESEGALTTTAYAQDDDYSDVQPPWEVRQPLKLPPTNELGGPPPALNAPTTVLPGIGRNHAQTLSRLGINKLHDMLYYFPRRYDDYSQLKPINRLWYGQEVTVIATIQSVKVRPLRNGKMSLVEIVVGDGTGALRVNWFNQVHLAKRLRPGAQIALSGKVDQYLGRLVMNSPEWEPLEQEQVSTNRIVPVYSLTAQITQRWLRRVMNQVVNFWAPRIKDPLPADLRRSASLMELPMALLQAHFPNTMDELNAARHRLAFDEIFLLQLGVLGQKRAWRDRTARVFETDQAWLEEILKGLPFALTNAQNNALNDARADLASGKPMNRLLQGDVGSGKTMIAALAAAIVIRSGSQVALMAPTSILAEQHYRNLLKTLAGEPQPSDDLSTAPESQPVLQPSQIRLMVGATSEAEKREIRGGLADGSLKLIIGTHALIEDPVTFADLQLVIVDEQHRFGVDQRAALRLKGENPHLLVMTATPIPRSLALTIYGDLDLSVMDEMPPGRQEISTHVLAPRERERAYTLIRSQVSAGRQAFIIYPLVEESEKSEAPAAVEEHARLQKEIFPKLKLGLLHGRMKPEEKDAVMAAFRDGEYQVLVSTSVIEVGVDVPNATVMLIEGANRFGLAQLHQFRGRVGRGVDKSYCLLVPDSPDAVENERLQVMAETNDGFILAERDLDQRGPGQFLGTRQSGYSELQMASLTDVHLIEKARRHAQALFEKDPDLSDPAHQALKEALQYFWGQSKGDIS